MGERFVYDTFPEHDRMCRDASRQRNPMSKPRRRRKVGSKKRRERRNRRKRK